MFIVKGNHETHNICSKFGFSDEIFSIYSSPKVYHACIILFNQLPLGATIDDQFLCVHGGIGPSFETLEQLAEIKRPNEGNSSEVVVSVLWSDPSDKEPGFAPNTIRGLGYFFGSDATLNFLIKNKLRGIIRAHEKQDEGYSSVFDSRVVTIFSCSSYCGSYDNCSATVSISVENGVNISQFDPLPYLRRKSAQFVVSNIAVIRPSSSIGALRLKKATSLSSFKSSGNFKDFQKSSFAGGKNIFPNGFQNDSEENIPRKGRLKASGSGSNQKLRLKPE